MLRLGLRAPLVARNYNYYKMLAVRNYFSTSHLFFCCCKFNYVFLFSFVFPLSLISLLRSPDVESNHNLAQADKISILWLIQIDAILDLFERVREGLISIVIERRRVAVLHCRKRKKSRFCG